MELNKTKIFDFIVSKANSESNLWRNAQLSIIATPSLNITISGKGGVMDVNNEYLPIAITYSDVIDYLSEYFKAKNLSDKVNRIDIVIENKQLVSMIERWDQSIVDAFEKNLPKSKIGKIKAWYLS